MLTPREIAEAAVRTLDAKMAKDIKLLCTTEQTVLADYFVICTATSSTHVKTLTDEVDKALSELGEPPLRRPCVARAIEAAAGSCWISAASSCTSSRRRCASFITSSTCGATRRR